jgi:hypothetical protein
LNCVKEIDMAVLYAEAYDAGFTAGSATPRLTYEASWANFVAASGGVVLPIDLADEFKRGWSSAMAYQMDAY